MAVIAVDGKTHKTIVLCDMLIAVNPHLTGSLGCGSRRRLSVLVLDELLLVVICRHRVGTMSQVSVQRSMLSHRQTEMIATTVTRQIATVSELTDR
jgi:hypothetical protein